MSLVVSKSRVAEGSLPCPSCPSSDAYHLYDDGHGYCFSCKYFKSSDKRSPFEEDMFTYEFIPHRGLTKKTLEFYDIKTKVDQNGKPLAVGFRWPNGAYETRLLASKEYRWDKENGIAPEPGLFGRDKFAAGSTSFVTITEGAYDAASIYQTIGGAAVSVRSSSSALADCLHERSWLNSFGRICIAFDADAPGRAATREVAKLFDYNKVLVLDYDSRKDANEFLQADAADDLKNLWQNAKRYLPETIISVTKNNIRSLLGAAPERGVSYPFSTLNEMTYGIRRGESVLLTAQEGVGKTALMHAIEYNLLRETDDAIGAIYLEEDKRDHLRALASIALQKPAHLPDSGCTESDIVSALQASIKADDRVHLYSHFGSDDPDILLDTIRFMVVARNVVYVLLDHLGICVSGLANERDERRALDYLSTRLAMMIKELNFSLIFVSHVNDEGKTRGSRLIAKDAHVRIDAFRDFMNVDERIKNTIRLQVSKNRPPSGPGKTGPAGEYLFDPYTRQYTELGAANDNVPLYRSKAA